MIALAVPPQWRPAPHPTARADAAKALKLGHYPARRRCALEAPASALRRAFQGRGERGSSRRAAGVGRKAPSSGEGLDQARIPRRITDRKSGQYCRGSSDCRARSFQVILVDANILIYAFDADSPQHASARRWLDGRLNDTARVALPWPSLLAFLRIVANPRVMQRPAGMELARTSANLARLSGCLNTTTWRTSRRHSRCDPCDPLRSWEPRDGCAPGRVGDRARF